MKLYHIIICVLFVLPTSFTAPHGSTKYDQRQEGEMNVRADLNNILILFIPSGGLKLMDYSQNTSLLEIFGKANKYVSPNKESPYKVDIDKAAIEKLQNDMDNINSILPVRKSFIEIEKKEISEEPSGTPTTYAPTTTNEVTTTVEAVVALKPSEKEKISTDVEKEKIPPTTEATTSIKIDDKKEKITPTTSKPVQEKAPEKATQQAESIREKTVQVSPIGVTVYAVKPPSNLPQIPGQAQVQKSAQEKNSKTPKNTDLDKREQQLAALRSGITHCSPGQKMTSNGECVEIERDSRTFNTEDMERLLSVLRFGLEPANEEK